MAVTGAVHMLQHLPPLDKEEEDNESLKHTRNGDKNKPKDSAPLMFRRLGWFEEIIWNGHGSGCACGCGCRCGRGCGCGCGCMHMETLVALRGRAPPPTAAPKAATLPPTEKKSVCLPPSAHPRHLCTLPCVFSVAAFLLWHPPAFAYETDTPYSQAQTQKLQMGLLNGKIRSCPSNINPNCISTSSMNATFGIPLEIPQEASVNATRKLLSAIQATQRNTKVLTLEDTPTGQFLQVEVDGVFGRDVMEFLVKSDVVTYRSLAEKVLYIYPFTTPLSDFGAQDKRIKAIQEELGWNASVLDSAY